MPEVLVTGGAGGSIEGLAATLIGLLRDRGLPAA